MTQTEITFPSGRTAVQLTSDEGKVLTNGDIYSGSVVIGTHDAVGNWREIPEEDVPVEDEDLDDSEALEILLGGGEA